MQDKGAIAIIEFIAFLTKYKGCWLRGSNYQHFYYWVFLRTRNETQKVKTGCELLL